MFYVPETHIMYTLYGAVDFLNVLKNAVVGGGGGGVSCTLWLLVHSEIYYVPVVDDWTQVLARNVIHYVPVLHPSHHLQVHNMMAGMKYWYVMYYITYQYLLCVMM
jgi:hypothetical protein